MELPNLKIGELVAKYPIIQGAMGVGVSLSNLAGAVAKEGGIGVISGVQIGYEEPGFEENHEAANVEGLRKHIRKAREISPEGILGVNLLVAIQNYKEMVKAAVEEKVDIIISGAGLPTELPKLVAGSNTKIAPIVSSGKAARLIAKMWDRKHQVIPDAVVVEGPEAGGHLGFSKEELDKPKLPNIYDLMTEVIEALKPYEEKYKKSIPVIAAGGIFDGKDIAKALKMGAAGVQIGTRFVATEECDAHPNFKEAYIHSNSGEIQLVTSPVGMPGRAVVNQLTERIKTANIPVEKCYNCLIPCNPKTTPYCISSALIKAVKGDVDQGLVFAGSNAYRITKMTTVRELMQELLAETKEFMNNEAQVQNPYSV